MQQSYQNRFRSDSGDRRQYRQDRGRPRYEQNCTRSNFRVNMRNLDKIAEESTEVIIGMKVMTEAGTDLEKGHFPEAITTIEIGVQAIVGAGQDQKQV